MSKEIKYYWGKEGDETLEGDPDDVLNEITTWCMEDKYPKTVKILEHVRTKVSLCMDRFLESIYDNLNADYGGDSSTGYKDQWASEKVKGKANELRDMILSEFDPWLCDDTGRYYIVDFQKWLHDEPGAWTFYDKDGNVIEDDANA